MGFDDGDAEEVEKCHDSAMIVEGEEEVGKCHDSALIVGESNVDYV